MSVKPYIRLKLQPLAAIRQIRKARHEAGFSNQLPSGLLNRICELNFVHSLPETQAGATRWRKFFQAAQVTSDKLLRRHHEEHANRPPLAGHHRTVAVKTFTSLRVNMSRFISLSSTNKILLIVLSRYVCFYLTDVARGNGFADAFQ